MGESHFEQVPQVQLVDTKATGDHGMEYKFEVSVGNAAPPIILVLRVDADQVQANANFAKSRTS